MSNSIWDQPDMQGGGGDFVRFDNVGDSVAGVITALRAYTFPGDDKANPQLDLNTATGPATLTASQANLRAQLAAARPEVGDTVSVTFSGTEPAGPGKSPKKLFTVNVSKAGASPVVPPAAPVAAPAAAATAPAGIDLSALPPEARAALEAANVLG